MSIEARRYAALMRRYGSEDDRTIAADREWRGVRLESEIRTLQGSGDRRLDLQTRTHLAGLLLANE